MRPEMPYLAAGSIAIAGGIAREKTWPSEGTSALLATMFLVVITSMTTGTKYAPLVRAIGLLAVLAAIMSAVPAFTASQKGKNKNG